MMPFNLFLAKEASCSFLEMKDVEMLPSNFSIHTWYILLAPLLGRNFGLSTWRETFKTCYSTCESPSSFPHAFIRYNCIPSWLGNSGGNRDNKIRDMYIFINKVLPEPNHIQPTNEKAGYKSMKNDDRSTKLSKTSLWIFLWTVEHEIICFDYWISKLDLGLAVQPNSWNSSQRLNAV